jgi:hypothetical protein
MRSGLARASSAPRDEQIVSLRRTTPSGTDVSKCCAGMEYDRDAANVHGTGGVV